MDIAQPRVVLHFVLLLTCFVELGLVVSAQLPPTRFAPSSDSFDVPLKTEVVDNGPSPYYEAQQNVRNKLSCYFYATFMVKQYDEGQKGSEWLAIAPVEGHAVPPCVLAHRSGEKVITYPEWGGYFLGAKGRLVFFRAEDEFNGGLPFVAYDSKTETRIFEDSYRDTGTFNRNAASSPFYRMRVFEGKDGGFSLKYLRVVEAGCDLHLDKSSCWETVRKKLGLQIAQIPVCTGYDRISTRFESAVAYPVEVFLFPKPVIKTIAGPVRCWPED
jgi:hypothetical protein